MLFELFGTYDILQSSTMLVAVRPPRSRVTLPADAWKTDDEQSVASHSASAGPTPFDVPDDVDPDHTVGIMTSGQSPCVNSSGGRVPCSRQMQRCSTRPLAYPTYHILDRGGCGNNDANGASRLASRCCFAWAPALADELFVFLLRLQHPSTTSASGSIT